MSALLRDISYGGFAWVSRADGDLARADGLEAMRDLLIRWLLTEPSASLQGLTEEENERRQRYGSGELRAAGTAPPAGATMTACLPWAPDWGAGIKRELGGPLTADTIERVKARVRNGLASLEGVTEVIVVRASATRAGRMTIAVQVRTDQGLVDAQTTVEAY